jgi:uncharacterized membrane protein
LIALARAISTLALCAISLTLFAWQVGPDSASDFSHDNDLTFLLRKRLLWTMLASAAAVGVAAFGFGLAGGDRRVRLIERLSRLAAPLMLAGLIPPLSRAATWDPLTLAITIAVFTLLSEQLLRVSLGALDELQVVPSSFRPGGFVRQRGWAAMVVCAAAFYAVYMARFTLFAHRRFQTYNFDLGQYDNVFWNALHGRPLVCTPLGMFSNWSSFGGHADLGVFFLLPFYAIRPNAETLLILQAALLGLGAIPLYFFAARRIPPLYAAVLAICYLLYPPLHGSNFYDFHFQPIAATFVLFTIWLVDLRRWVWASLAFVCAISCREDISVGLTMLGLYLLLTGYRPRAGILMAIVGTVYFVVIRFFVMNRFGQGWFADIYKDLYPRPDGPTSFAGVMYTLVTNPVYVFRTLLTSDKLRYFLQIVTPVAFLPLRRVWLWPALAPGALFTLLTTAYPPTTDIGFQYSGHFTPYLFAASAVALAAYQVDLNAIRLRAALVALGLGTLLTTAHWGAFPPNGTIKGGFAMVGFGHPTVADEQKAKDLAELAAMIPTEAKFAVSEEELPHVSGRLGVMTLKYGVGAAEYVLYGPSSQGGSIGAQAASDGTFVELARRAGVVLLKRKH